ncbi:MAG: hypothetical protein Q7J68_03775 [Thermoplasmata archaeon]|nr:hypothetical protein [Thermoplasmata archaeon]
MILECPECNSRSLSLDHRTNMYKCKNCNATFDTPIKIDKMSPSTIALIATMIMVAITVTLAAILYSMVISMKPAIYLYTPREEKEQLKLKVKGVITTRIPFREGISSIIWDDLVLKNGKIFTNKKSFDYLFYESKNVMPEHENTGWILKRQNGALSWNQAPIDKNDLSEMLRNILAKYGLFENEINDFIEYWFDDDMKIFFGQDEFTFGIYPISLEEVDRIFSIETMLEYPEYIRVQLLVKEIEDGEVLAEPEFPKISRSEYALHEWGMMKG